MEPSHRQPMNVMSEEQRKTRVSELATAIAEGNSVAEWARANKVPERTAYRWARDPRVRAEVDSRRRRAVDEAIGRMAERVSWATRGIATLAEHAKSESVRLAALRSFLADMISASEFSGLEQRITEIEEHIHAQTAASTGGVG